MRIQDELGIQIKMHDSLFASDQPQETKKRLEEFLESLDEWQLAGKSLL